jgi:hypothetical protein
MSQFPLAESTQFPEDENLPGNSTKTEVWGSQLRVGPETFLQCFYLSAIVCNQSIFLGKEPRILGMTMAPIALQSPAILEVCSTKSAK